jgi:hypothetical protein
MTIDREPAKALLESLGVLHWPVWEKEVSIFPWQYEQTETCYLLDGDVLITPQGQEPVCIGAGDLVTFPAGMSCTWDIRKPVRKHYRFS